jgi:hypothetical protein
VPTTPLSRVYQLFFRRFIQNTTTTPQRMTQIIFYRKKLNGLYDGHQMMEDGIIDMAPSYRVVAGKTISPMFPVTNHPQRPGYDPQQGSYYFVPAQELTTMSVQERQNLAKVLHYYDTNINASSSQITSVLPAPGDWCPSADPCLPLNNVCCQSKKRALTRLEIGWIAAVGALVLVGTTILVKQNRKWLSQHKKSWPFFRRFSKHYT